MNKYNPIKPLINTMNSQTPKLEFSQSTDFKQWRKLAYNKLIELTGYDRFQKVEPELDVEYKKEYDSYLEIRFNMKTEVDFEMPCYLLIPKGVENPPLMICIQGHDVTMENSIGKDRFGRSKEETEIGCDFALQAINHNMAALCIEQRGMGERKENIETKSTECHLPTMTELLLGRTIIGARVWDIARAIDVMEEYFTEIDAKRIYIVGNSGGGTVSYYATCLEHRIKAVMPSCSVSSFKHSIATIKHCVCNHIPHILDSFDMGDLAGLIAPRPIVVVAGKGDTIFPIVGILDAYKKIESIYDTLGDKDNCTLIVGDNGHHFYPELAWPKFMELVK